MAKEATELRDSRGEWKPEELPKPGPLFRWPLNILKILKFLFLPGGYLLGWNGIFLGVGVISWLFLTPEMDRMATFTLDWVALIYLRNAGILTLLAGGLHIRLYMRRVQGQHFKFSDKWLAKDNKRFLFNNQTRENVFMNLASGCVIWTGYEALTLWAYANNLLPYVDWNAHPLYFVLLLLGIAAMREIHFYWTHRLTHWKPLYTSAHYLHHRNVNIGPWSGFSMHPIEHLLYLSGIFLHWVIPSHPVHAIAHVMHAGLAPSPGHTGFRAPLRTRPARRSLSGIDDPSTSIMSSLFRT
jgi:sterol desaturase/sphingolipid hydroxylase (fatty acid hydroxylase superfamily)